jgi:hypothetical protein
LRAQPTKETADYKGFFQVFLQRPKTAFSGLFVTVSSHWNIVLFDRMGLFSAHWLDFTFGL